jgi:phenylalanyl-tRNA synthetase beta chain
MKLSIAWIFDHLEADWKDYDIAQLVAKFNTTTAEIEHVSKKVTDLEHLSLGQVTKVASDKITLFSPEWQKEFSFPHRPAHPGNVFLITKNGWAILPDLGGEKEGLIPPLYVLDEELAGKWKEKFETEDYILELDNKSITHRPDMWSHRGFAREAAAILEVPLKPLSDFLEHRDVKKYESDAPATPKEPFAITVKNPEKIKHFAGLYIEHVEATSAALLWMAHRLIKIDSRPISIVVDCTNYVMQDIGQPMHAFDGQKLKSKKIEPRMAKKGESILLLDGQKVELEPQDIIITDGKTPIALGGIMGGKESGIHEGTESAFIEAACFDAGTIRRTSTRLRLRTEASARFEKSLDPHLNVLAIERFLKLLHDSPLATKITSPIISVGHEPVPVVLEISHDFIESRLGEHVSSEKIKTILEKLEFQVHEKKDTTYQVAVPSFRATKDVALKEDIVEEIGRFVGYANIPLALPSLTIKPKDLTATNALRAIKKQCAYALAMHEVHNYAFYDEEFLLRLKWHPDNPVTLKNPVSEHWTTLVTSLIPHLFKNVYQNEVKEDRLRFFESARVWSHDDKKVQEQKSIAGIFFDRKNQIDFYAAKAELAELFETLSVDVVWQKPAGHKVWGSKKKLSDLAPWFNPHQTAVILHNGFVIGVAGKAEKTFLANVVDGDAFIFELNGDFLTSYQPPLKKFAPLPKYPIVRQDISMLVPVQVTVQDVTQIIEKADAQIIRVELLDFFEKKEWQEQRSLTFRYYIQDRDKTLEKSDIDRISHSVVEAVKKTGVEVR